MVRKDYSRGSRSGSRVTGAKLVILMAALMGSAYVLAMALRSPEYWWMAWICLLPLFCVIRMLQPVAAALSGVIWGISFFLCSTHGALLTISVTLPSLMLTALVPAIYCGLGSSLTRRIGFNPIILALGWIGVELAFKPLGLNKGLLSATQVDSIHFDWIGRLLGYIFVAFLVACINATLLAVLGKACFYIQRVESIIVGFYNCIKFFTSQTFLHFQFWIFPQEIPRAPP